MAEERERDSKCMWCDEKDHEDSECPTNSVVAIFNSITRSLEVKLHKYDTKPIEESSSTTIIDDDDMNEQETSSWHHLWRQCDFVPIFEFRSSIAPYFKVDVNEVDSNSANYDDNKSEFCEPEKVYSENCFLKSMNLDELNLYCPPNELCSDEFSVKYFYKGLKGSEDDSCKKAERQETLSDKSKFDDPTLMSENSYEVKLDSSIHIEKENAKKERTYPKEGNEYVFARLNLNLSVGLCFIHVEIIFF